MKKFINLVAKVNSFVTENTERRVTIGITLIVATVGQLRKMTEVELMSCKNMTQKTFDEIIKLINCLVKTGKKE